MNSNLHMRDHLLPIGVMNVISIVPLLLLAPLIELVTSCYLSVGKTPLAPVKVISMYLLCTLLYIPISQHTILIITLIYLSPPYRPVITSSPRPLLCSPSHHPSLLILPFQCWAMCLQLYQSCWQVCLSFREKRTL